VLTTDERKERKREKEAGPCRCKNREEGWNADDELLTPRSTVLGSAELTAGRSIDSTSISLDLS
jgi:hypothetical protein